MIRCVFVGKLSPLFVPFLRKDNIDLRNHDIVESEPPVHPWNPIRAFNRRSLESIIA